jgi:subtilisin family serine protease
MPCEDQIYSEDYADLMIDSGTALNTLTAIPNSCSFQLVDNTYNVYIPIDSLPRDLVQSFGYGAIPNTYGLMDIDSLDASGVTRIQNIPSLNLRGQGVLIGLIDTGIDYRHEAFIKEDGTSKIVRIWDQSIRGVTPQPDYLPFGTEYSQEQINQALASEDPLSIVPSIDEIGHGTFLAGIAAGNRNDAEDFSGVAPDAELVIVKFKPAKIWIREFWKTPLDAITYQKNDLIMGINYLVQLAERVNRPMSIIIGIGTSQGAHDERGALSRYISTLASRDGICISIAGGNEGNTGHHYLGTVMDGQDLVELQVGPNVSGFSMEFWGVTPANFSIDITSPSGEYIPRIPARRTETRVIKFIFERTIINVDYQLVEAQSGDQLILLRFTLPSQGLWSFRVYSSADIVFSFHVWLPIERFLGRETFFIRSNPNYTLTSPGNTFLPIVTTAYDNTTGQRYIDASRGFMRTENIAPTLAAPGVALIGPAIPSGYTTFTGTSVAAAHTAGIGAMLLEWGIVQGKYDPISTIEIRNLLIRGTKREASIIYPNREWGYGILDLVRAYDTFRSSD